MVVTASPRAERMRSTMISATSEAATPATAMAKIQGLTPPAASSATTSDTNRTADALTAMRAL